MDACALDMLLRDFIAEVLRVLERRRHEPDLKPSLDAVCMAASARIRNEIPPDDFERLQIHVLLALQINGRCDHGVRLGFFWLAGEAVEHDFDSAEVARAAARLRDALMGRAPHGRE
ncbi:hypothetical protein [Pararobbsia alpina]|uniref:Uncharacterized protein n=1 Tax=Pararobbsia alpina TaxID=621374 RepID=A0A6S7C8A9_9BURK|nr:hypothetical protein [Pararobbsia alpina]CAB3783479.1 hypothetical protein LMG28138_01648 [Pararobbsia alpina]